MLSLRGAEARKYFSIFKYKNAINMELVSVALLWVGDVMGLKWVRDEPDGLKRLAKGLIYLVSGVIAVMITFALFF